MARDGLWINVGQARQFAGQINNGIGGLQSLIETITSMLGDTYWNGEDAQNFAADWHDSFRPQAQHASERLSETSREFLRRAASQEELSERGH